MTNDREHCTDESECASGKRNRFYRGKAMKAEEFEAEQEYFIKRRRLLNRSLAGWGVVYGFAMNGVHPAKPTAEAVKADALRIGKGLALDQHGREIILVDEVEISPSNTFLLEESEPVTIVDAAAQSESASGKSRPLKSGKYLLSVHYAERSFGKANLPADCGCERTEKRFVCEEVVFSLKWLKEGKCRCEEKPCPRCDCKRPGPCDEESRGPHSCLCEWTSDAHASAALHPPKLSTKWHGLEIDPSDGVPLACIEAGETGDKCNPIGIVIDDDCSPRRLVKNNDLLYDLLRGCDLTRIQSISWGKYHRSDETMPWPFFLRLLETPSEKDASYDDTPGDAGPLGLRVRFTAPVQAGTVSPDCFEIRFVVRSSDTGWFEMRIVRVLRVEKQPWQGDADYTREVFLRVDPRWRSEVTKGPNVLEIPSVVQIDVYGDFILDCNGQALDANPRGFGLREGYGKISGNGSPGGTFRSVFRLDKHPEDSDGSNHESKRSAS